MIVTIDGPAGAGKSHAARMLAERLDFRFLDTGAMYRAVALAASRRNVDWFDASAVAELANDISIAFKGDRIELDGEDVTREIRSPDITSVIHFVADNPGVRKTLTELQRKFASGKNVVAEGRDQGTVVFPNADCKIYLTATPEERAKRRFRDLQERVNAPTFEEVLAQQNERDRRDESRPVGKLCRADDAIEIITNGLSLAEVVDQLEFLVADKKS